MCLPRSYTQQYKLNDLSKLPFGRLTKAEFVYETPSPGHALETQPELEAWSEGSRTEDEACLYY